MDLYAESFAGDIILADQGNLYAMWIFPQKVSLPFHIPCWIWFQTKLWENKIITQSNDGYLDCLDAPATDMSTMYHMMQRSIQIKEQLQLKSIVCVYDQTIYTKAFQIKCAEPDWFKDVFLTMGTFHIILNFLAVIAMRFKDAGLCDIVVQSTIVTKGSGNTTFGGSRAYNRAIRTYKILYKALYQILIDDFKLDYPTECNKVQEAVSTEEDKLVQGCINTLSSKYFHNYCMQLITLKEQLAKSSD